MPICSMPTRKIVAVYGWLERHPSSIGSLIEDRGRDRPRLTELNPPPWFVRMSPEGELVTGFSPVRTLTVKSEAPSTMQLDWISCESYVCSADSIHERRQGLRRPP